MPTFAEWEARRKGAVLPNTPVAANAAPDDLTEGPLGEMRHATAGDDPTSAFEGELLRTGKEAAIGLARSPVDLVKGTVNAVVHPLDTLMGLGRAIAHPVDTAMALAKNPREAGSTLGQLLLAPKVPGAANTVLAEGPTVAGRAISAVGRGAEAAGTSKVARIASKYGPLEAVVRGDPYGLAAAAVPPALEYGGRGLQKIGGALEGLDLSIKENPFRRGAPVPEVVDPEAETVRETVKTARGFKDKGMSAKQAGQRAGWPLAQSEEVPYQMPDEPVNTDLFPYQKDSLQALREAAGVKKLAAKFGENAWAKDASAVDPRTNPTYPDGRPVPVTTVANESPIEKFYREDPQARVGGEGRMTGQFEEGNGGLSDVLNGNVDQHVTPSALDELSQLSGRALSPEDAQALLDRFRNFKVGV